MGFVEAGRVEVVSLFTNPEARSPNTEARITHYQLLITNSKLPITNYHLRIMNYGLRDNKWRGFTLIELLVVISIIGILSSVALVNLNQSRIRARLASVQTTMNNLRQAAVLCQASYAGIGDTGELNCYDSDNTDSGHRCEGGATLFIVPEYIDHGTPIIVDICLDVPQIGQWPKLETGWIWTQDNTGSQTWDWALSDAAASSFYFAACEGDAATATCNSGGNRIECDQNGCQTKKSLAI